LPPYGLVVDSKLSSKLGKIATLLVQGGTLREKNLLLANGKIGKIKRIVDFQGKNVNQAFPGDPVQVIGLDFLAEAGEKFLAIPDDKFSKKIGKLLADYQIERKDLGQAGGKQDQYAAAFGGFNFMEFYSDDKVIVNPLRIKENYLNEMQYCILLYYTGTSRLSSKIIEMQSGNVSAKKEKSIDAMHKLKEQAVMMKEAILRGNLNQIGEILNFGWLYKKQTAEGISNPMIDEIYEAAIKAGALGGKISGAGGGGFMFFYCPNFSRYTVIERLHQFGGEFRRFQFTKQGASVWLAR